MRTLCCCCCCPRYGGPQRGYERCCAFAELAEALDAVDGRGGDDDRLRPLHVLDGGGVGEPVDCRGDGGPTYFA